MIMKNKNSMPLSRLKVRLRVIITCSFVLVMSLLLSGCDRAERGLTAEEEEQLKRKELGIKTQTKWSHEVINQIRHFDKEGRLIDEQWLNPKGTVVTRRVLEYDEKNGNLSKTTWYKGREVLKSRYFYTYDQQGNLIEENRKTPAGETQAKIVFEYENDKLINEIRYDRFNNLFNTGFYTYDNGILREFLQKDRRDLINVRHLYEYDENGNLTEERWLNAEGEIQTRREYSYKNGLLLSKIQYNNGEYSHRRDCEYKDNGLLLRETWHDVDEEQIFENIYTYEYF